MNFEPSRIDPLHTPRGVPERGATPPAHAPGAFAAALRRHTTPVRLDAIPASPPPELRHDILAAQRAIRDMHDRGRELRFDTSGERVRIEVRDLDGNVLREIPPSRVLELLDGKEVE